MFAACKIYRMSNLLQYEEIENKYLEYHSSIWNLKNFKNCKVFDKIRINN